MRGAIGLHSAPSGLDHQIKATAVRGHSRSLVLLTRGPWRREAFPSRAFLRGGADRAGLVAERVGFEPTVPFQARRISSAVHSTTLPPLQGVFGARPGAGLE